jgi:hypothetical protein
MLLRLPAQTFDRIAAALDDGEDKVGFVRSSVLRELERRERAGEKRRAQAKARKPGRAHV